MSISLKVTSSLALAVLALGTCQVASAQPQHGRSNLVPSNAADESASVTPAAAAAGHSLVKTFLRQGYSGADLGGGEFTLVDSVVINCPKGPCTINAHLLAENGGSTFTANETGLWFTVDGIPTTLCFDYWIGLTPADGSYDDVAQDCYVNGVKTGNHTIQYYYDSELGAVLAHWQATYTLYTP